MVEKDVRGGDFWPAHTYEVRPWVSSLRASNRNDRMLESVTVSLPPLIAELDYTPPRGLVSTLDSAKIAIVELDRAHSAQLGPLARLLLRTESVASSRIEDVDATSDDFARATAGVKSNERALSMVSASTALDDLITKTGSSGRLTLAALLDAHRLLMSSDPTDGRYAGMLRPMQNWIGGNHQSPLNALHVPPPPETVPRYLDDLLEFANRDDVDAIAQAAIVHAQFESIHPFTDGNGRIGRALISAVLRRRRLASSTVVPIASALLAERDHYFDLVNDYRGGAVTPFVQNLALAATIASAEASASAVVLRDLPATWQKVATPRANSATALLLATLLDHPIVSAADAMTLTGASETSVLDALARLDDNSITHEVTGRRRDRVWVATDVMAELDNLNARIAAAVRSTDLGRASAPESRTSPLVE